MLWGNTPRRAIGVSRSTSKRSGSRAQDGGNGGGAGSDGGTGVAMLRADGNTSRRRSGGLDNGGGNAGSSASSSDGGVGVAMRRADGSTSRRRGSLDNGSGNGGRIAGDERRHLDHFREHTRVDGHRIPDEDRVDEGEQGRAEHDELHQRDNCEQSMDRNHSRKVGPDSASNGRRRPGVGLKIPYGLTDEDDSYCKSADQHDQGVEHVDAEETPVEEDEATDERQVNGEGQNDRYEDGTTGGGDGLGVE